MGGSGSTVVVENKSRTESKAMITKSRAGDTLGLDAQFLRLKENPTIAVTV
jgi:hypothetical protein